MFNHEIFAILKKAAPRIDRAQAIIKHERLADVVGGSLTAEISIDALDVARNELLEAARQLGVVIDAQRKFVASVRHLEESGWPHAAEEAEVVDAEA